MTLRWIHYVGAVLAGVLVQALLLAGLAVLAEASDPPPEPAPSRQEVSFETPPLETRVRELEPDTPTDPKLSEADSHPAPAEFRAPPLPSMFRNPTAWERPPSLSGGLPGPEAVDASPEPAPPQVREADQVERPPQVLAGPLPRYPAELETRQVEGVVVLKMLIDATGSVSSVQVLHSEPPGLFEEAATRAAQRWRFRPAEHQGTRVPVWVRQTLRFTLP
jgi:protein TonB